MAIPLPPDPYKALGVESTAPEGDIRKVYLRLVLKCHPDKIQDPTLRAQKTDEFHKIQEAWDLLSDKAKRDDYDEKVRMNARSSATRASAGAPRPTRSGGFPSPTPAGYNAYDFHETANANIYTAEPRDRDSRRRREPSPVRVYAQHSSKTRSYEDDLPTRYDDEPRMRKSASAEHSGRKPSSANTDRERRRAEEDRERDRDRYERDRKKKEYADSKKSRDRDNRSGRAAKTSTKSAFIVDESPDEMKYDSREHRSKKADRGGDALLEEFDNMSMGANFVGEAKEYEAIRYMSAAKSRAKGVPPAPPPAPPAAQMEAMRPRGGMQRAETFSTYTTPPTQFHYEDETIHRSSARPSSRRPSADAAMPRSSDPMAPHIVTAEPPFARKPSLQHHNSAPPIFTERMPTRSQTLQPEPPRRPPASMPTRAQTFNDKYNSPSPLKQSRRAAAYDDISDSSSSDDGPYARPAAPVKRPSVQKVYKVESKGGQKFAAVVEEAVYRKRSSSPHTRRSSDRPAVSSRSSGTTVRQKPSHHSSSSSRHYDDIPSVRASPRIVPGNSKSGGGSYFGEVQPNIQYADYGGNVRYSDYDSRGSSAMPTHAYYSPRREAVN